MKKISEFSNISDARNYSYDLYRKIGGNEARQFFCLCGAMSSIESVTEDSTPCIDLDLGINTTLGQIARAIIQTINNGQFATDPTSSDGALNRRASTFMVEHGVYSSEIESAFFSRAKTVIKPYENTSEYEWAKSVGLSIPKTEVYPENGYLKLSLKSSCEKHSPSLYTEIQGVETRIASYPLISEKKDYIQKIPTGYTSYKIDNYYGVI